MRSQHAQNIVIAIIKKDTKVSQKFLGVCEKLCKSSMSTAAVTLARSDKRTAAAENFHGRKLAH